MSRLILPVWFMLNKNFLNFNQQSGFTLVEAMAAMMIAIVGIIGAYELVNRSLSMANVASNKFVALYLASEGLEIARNIRDTNYLKIYHDGSNAANWNDELSDCLGGCGADYTSPELSSGTCDDPLKLSGGFFGYGTGVVVSYRRKITVVEQPNYMEVVSEVSWSDGSGNHVETVAENLYNWWQ